MSELAQSPWLSIFAAAAQLVAFCSGVALLVLMMLSSAALLFRDIADAAVSHQGASAEMLIGRDGHACDECSGDAEPAPAPAPAPAAGTKLAGRGSRTPD